MVGVPPSVMQAMSSTVQPRSPPIQSPAPSSVQQPCPTQQLHVLCRPSEQSPLVTAAPTIVALIQAVAVIVLASLLLWRRKCLHKSSSVVTEAGPECHNTASQELQEHARCAVREVIKLKDDGYVALSVAREQSENSASKGGQEYAYATVQEDKTDCVKYLYDDARLGTSGQSGPVISEYLKMKDSPVHQVGQEYASLQFRRIRLTVSSMMIFLLESQVGVVLLPQSTLN